MKRFVVVLLCVVCMGSMLLGSVQVFMEKAEASEKQGDFSQAIQHYVSAVYVNLLSRADFQVILARIHTRTGAVRFKEVSALARQAHIQLMREKGDNARQFINDINAIYDWIDALSF